jgi:hypothetical protein
MKAIGLSDSVWLFGFQKTENMKLTGIFFGILLLIIPSPGKQSLNLYSEEE